MAEGSIIWIICPRCDGSGEDVLFEGDPDGVGGVVENDCPRCNGSKYVHWGYLSKEEQELPENLPEP